MGVLGGQHDRRDLDRLAIFIADRKLRLGVRAKGGGLTRLAGLGQTAQDRMGILDRRRHQLGRFAHGIAEHDALVAGAFVLVVGGIDALGDMGRLFMQKVGDLAGFPVEFLLLVADIADAIAGDLFDLLFHLGQARLVGQPDLTADHHTVGGGKGFAGDTGLGLFGQEGVKNSIRDTVADLVGVTLGNGFRSEKIILSGHVVLHWVYTATPGSRCGSRKRMTSG